MRGVAFRQLFHAARDTGESRRVYWYSLPLTVSLTRHEARGTRRWAASRRGAFAVSWIRSRHRLLAGRWPGAFGGWMACEGAYQECLRTVKPDLTSSISRGGRRELAGQLPCGIESSSQTAASSYRLMSCSQWGWWWYCTVHALHSRLWCESVD